MVRRTAPDGALFGTAALVFAASATITVRWCASMSAMDGTPMRGGWILSPMWIRMCGQTWLAAGTSFLGMWLVMMAAMMLPSLVPMLRRYRRNVRALGGTHLDRLTAALVAGYFLVWTLLGAAVFTLGATIAAAELRIPALAGATPIDAGAIVLIGGALQFTRWKARLLACCRRVPGHCRTLPADTQSACRYGMRLGLDCSTCCAGLTASLLAIGMMDLPAMVTVTAAITFERMVPAGARAIGAVTVGAGLFMIGQTLGFGSP